MIYRGNNLDDTASTLRSQGWKEDKKLEIPPGPCIPFVILQVMLLQYMKINVQKLLNSSTVE